ncbi:MAG TPA: outer membrane protein transport protein [Pseudolabrys sp.]|nr:outer membrane protein transport protein [Pseudolabrys sp.]
MLVRRAIALLAIGAAGATVLSSTKTYAGGFALREQSAYGEGASYAGVAAGGVLSSMFWNPATMTQMPGIQTEVVATAVFPYAANNPTGGPLLVFGGTGNTGDSAVVPSIYASWQISPDWWVGLSVNSPFGLSVSFPELWAGRDYGNNDNHLRTYNATPSIAYRINNWISVGLGIQVQYADALLNKGISAGAPPFPDFTLSGNGWGWGLTAGVTLTPTPFTTIGLGYRSAINQKIDGNMNVTGILAPVSTNGAASTTLKLPDTISLGIRQRLDPRWTVMGTFEWTNWSRIGTSTVHQGSGAPSTVAGIPVTLPFQFKDGWFGSLGVEYQCSPEWMVRAGVGYEKSPVSDTVRIPILPDNDRFWLSAGASYKINRALSFDIAYSHLFVKDAPIDISPASGNPWFDGVVYQGNVKAHVDIVSLALRYRWDEPAPVVKTSIPRK